MKTLIPPPNSLSPMAQPPKCMTLSIDDDGIAWLTFDQPGSSANLLSEATLRELDDHLDSVELNPEIKALVFVSGKDRVFIAGADLKAVRTLPDWRVETLISLGQAVFCRIASLEIPTVAAIHGACVGGGMELALACDFRVATDADITRMGLPETQLGLIPAWGGCTRLPRLIGLTKALDMILAGKLLKSHQAKKCGLIDEMTSPEHLRHAASRLATHGLTGTHKTRHLVNHRPISGIIGLQARRQLLKKTRGLYEAPVRALEVIIRNLHSTLDDALTRERDTMLNLARGQQAAHLIDLFFMKEAADKHPLPGPAAPAITSAAVIGAGVMGAGIAHWLALKGIAVLLCEVSADALARGLERIRHLLDEGVSRRQITRKQAREAMDRIAPAHERVPLYRYPLVIEAATEDLELKTRIFADLAKRTGPETILATNTSALSVAKLAATAPHPERVLGLHFFNPVHRMPLVEVIRLPESAPHLVSALHRFSQFIGKTPVVVRDSPGFIVNRILTPYLMEAVRLYEQGYAIQRIDEAMLNFGMPMGPLRLLDEIGLDVADHVAKTLGVESNVLTEMIKEGRMGKKSGTGFYDHKTGRPIESAHTIKKPPFDIQLHLSSILTQEAERVLDSNIARDSSDLDLAMILGTGYPPFRGGPLAGV